MLNVGAVISHEGIVGVLFLILFWSLPVQFWPISGSNSVGLHNLIPFWILFCPFLNIGNDRLIFRSEFHKKNNDQNQRADISTQEIVAFTKIGGVE